MDSRNEWGRRRFLAIAGGTTVLAGCAAEPVEDGEEANETGSSDDTADSEDEGDAIDDTGDESDDSDRNEDTPEESDDLEGDEDDSEEDDTDDGEDGDSDEAEADDADGELEGETGDEEAEDETGEDADGESDDDADEDDELEEDSSDDDEDVDDDQASDDGTSEDETQDEASDDGNEDPEEPPLSAISIRVLDPDGEAIEGASVHGEGEPHEADIPLEFDGETDGSGTHENTIYENEYTIEIDHPDYEPETIDHTHDGETEATVELEPVVEEPPVSEITVRVVDTEGEPIEGAGITGNGESHPADIPLEFDGETDEDGVLSTPIYENEYTIEIDHPDYESETIDHTHDGETEVAVELEQPGTPLTIVAIDPATGEPMDGAAVAVYGNVIEPVTNPIDVGADGSVTVLVEEDSEVDVVVTDGFHPTDTSESQGVVVDSEPKTVEIEALEWPDSCSVSVEVVDEHGEPIEGAEVNAHSEPDVIHVVDSDDAVTDADGAATFEMLCGSWGFEVRAEGYTDAGDHVEITGDDHRTFELESTADDS